MMDDHADFDSVSWQREAVESPESPDLTADSPERTLPIRNGPGRRTMSNSSEPQAGEQAEGVGVGEGSMVGVTGAVVGVGLALVSVALGFTGRSIWSLGVAGSSVGPGPGSILVV